MFPLFPILAAAAYNRSLERDDEHRRVMRKLKEEREELEEEKRRREELEKKIKAVEQKAYDDDDDYGSDSYDKSSDRYVSGYAVTINGHYKYAAPEKLRRFELRYTYDSLFEAHLDCNEILKGGKPSCLFLLKDTAERCVASFKSGNNKSFNNIKGYCDLDMDSLKVVKVYE